MRNHTHTRNVLRCQEWIFHSNPADSACVWTLSVASELFCARDSCILCVLSLAGTKSARMVFGEWRRLPASVCPTSKLLPARKARGNLPFRQGFCGGSSQAEAHKSGSAGALGSKHNHLGAKEGYQSPCARQPQTFYWPWGKI